jgi:hypothetical protein
MSGADWWQAQCLLEQQEFIEFLNKGVKNELWDYGNRRIRDGEKREYAQPGPDENVPDTGNKKTPPVQSANLEILRR